MIPELPVTHVPRPVLVRRLDGSVTDFAITLVAGFAGSGKTVLVAEWARSQPIGRVVWLSCDLTDTDPAHFWCALVGALQTIDPAIGVDALDLVGPDGRLGHDAIASIVNDLFDLDENHVLVIDDLHVAARAALESLGELLERLPSRLRIVLSTRSDPPLPLHLWRARARLGEVRAVELRMSASEIEQLVGTLGVRVSPDDAAVLADRTEGWPAGVQLAALSMRHEREPTEFIHTFAGTDRNVADFLVGEVLRRQPDDTVDFLLHTSVLDELSGPLCDALSERSDTAEMLHRLEHDHLFIIPLDHEQTRYRYHHLFAELLRRMLAARHPGRAVELHRTASGWYADHDDPRRAVRHAILAEDPILVTQLLRGRMFTEFFTTSELIREWINELSRDRVDMPAELMLEYALALSLIGAIEDARVLLARVERMLSDDAPAVTRARLAIAHALTLGLRGEIEPAVAAAERVRTLVEPGTDAFIDGALPHILLRTSIFTDDPGAARVLYERSRSQPSDPEQLEQFIFEGMFSQAEMELGELESARAHAEAAAAAMRRLEAGGHFGFNDTLRTLGALAYEQDHVDEAEELLERCVELVQTSRPIFLLLTRIELARVWNARGDPEATFTELDRARAALPRDIRSPLIDRVEAYRARLLAERGDVPNALELVVHLPAGRRRSVVEVRCHLGEGNVEAARRILARLRAPSTTQREALEYGLLDARVALGEHDADLSAKLQQVLSLGRSGGFIRTLADEGPELAAGLAEEVRHQPSDVYFDRLVPVLQRAVVGAPARNVPLFAGVMLSDRELTVLKYLATRLTTREIAAELYVSMNTFRTHSKSIYRKLGVDSRAAAVDAARTIGIL